jgi:hypothetical protein
MAMDAWYEMMVEELANTEPETDDVADDEGTLRALDEDDTGSAK